MIKELFQWNIKYYIILLWPRIHVIHITRFGTAIDTKHVLIKWYKTVLWVYFENKPGHFGKINHHKFSGTSINLFVI